MIVSLLVACKMVLTVHFSIVYAKIFIIGAFLLHSSESIISMRFISTKLDFMFNGSDCF